MGYCGQGLDQIKTTQTPQVQMIHSSTHDKGSALNGNATAQTRTDPFARQKKPALTGKCVAQCTTSEPVLESLSTTSSLITSESHFFLYSVSNWGKGERKGKVLNIARRGFALVFVLSTHTYTHTEQTCWLCKGTEYHLELAGTYHKYISNSRIPTVTSKLRCPKPSPTFILYMS